MNEPRFNKRQLAGIRRRWELGEPLAPVEAAELLGVPVSTLRDRLRPVPACRRLGRRRFWLPADIRRALWGSPHEERLL